MNKAEIDEMAIDMIGEYLTNAWDCDGSPEAARTFFLQVDSLMAIRERMLEKFGNGIA